MAKIKTSKAIDAALDWAAAMCAGQSVKIIDGQVHDSELLDMQVDGNTLYRPSTDWLQGGLIIDQEGISTRFDSRVFQGDRLVSVTWSAAPEDENYTVTGPSALVAAMRCFVKSKLGPEIEVPDELLEKPAGKKRLKP